MVAGLSRDEENDLLGIDNQRLSEAVRIAFDGFSRLRDGGCHDADRYIREMNEALSRPRTTEDRLIESAMSWLRSKLTDLRRRR